MVMILTAHGCEKLELLLSRRQVEEEVLNCMEAALSASGVALEALPSDFQPGEYDVSSLKTGKAVSDSTKSHFCFFCKLSLASSVFVSVEKLPSNIPATCASKT